MKENSKYGYQSLIQEPKDSASEEMPMNACYCHGTQVTEEDLLVDETGGAHACYCHGTRIEE